jgi:hypothetical protein
MHHVKSLGKPEKPLKDSIKDQQSYHEKAAIPLCRNHFQIHNNN